MRFLEAAARRTTSWSSSPANIVRRTQELTGAESVVRRLGMPVIPKSALVLLLLFASSLASAQPSQVVGLSSVRRALADRYETPRETDSNAVEIRAGDDAYQVFALTDVEMEHRVDVHRNVLNRERHANRYSLCTTPCRLVIRQPLLLSVEGVDVVIAPEAQRQRWVVIPERSGLRTFARVMSVVSVLGAVVGFFYYSAGGSGRILNPDTNRRGGLAGVVLGTSAFIASVTAARRMRGRATREY
ncbi:MAG: hypothetical protein ACI9KE_002779 [Polyangiales bacterium]|jgi:hypothetical protein